MENETGYAYQGNNYLVHEGVDLNAVSTAWIVSKAYHVESAYELSFYWRGRWSSAYDFYLDGANVAAIPYCGNPDTIEITNRGTDFLDVSWSAVTDVNNYEISWVPAGFD